MVYSLYNVKHNVKRFNLIQFKLIYLFVKQLLDISNLMIDNSFNDLLTSI